MKKKRILSCILSVFLLASTLLAGACKNNEENSSSGAQSAEGVTYNLSHTIHGGKVQATGESIVKNGANNGYTLVKSKNASGAESSAVAMFRAFFNEATGVNLPVLEVEDGASWTENAKVISFGENAYQKAANVTFDKSALTNSGFILKTVGKSVFCMGGTLGVKYSAYELLKYYFGFEYYAPECYDLQTGVTDLPFYELDIKERPDIEYVSSTSGILGNSTDPYYRDGLRVSGSAPLVGYNNHPWHNTFDFIPIEEYFVSNRNWFADGQGNSPEQLCYTRDPEGMVPIVVAKMKEVLVANPNAEFATFVQQDCGAFCECDSCKALQAKYGDVEAGNAAGIIIFLNMVAKEIDAFTKDPEDELYGRKIQIVNMSYVDTENPPVKKNADGTFSLIDDEVVCADNMVTVLAQTGVKYIPFEDSGNQEIWDNITGWSLLCDELMFWQYPMMYYANFMFFNDVYSSQQKNFQKMVESHAIWLYDQGQYNTPTHTAFEMLRTYLSCKLSYNCQIDYDKAVNDFFNAYFGPAQAPMRAMFDGFRNRFAYLYSIGQAGSGSYDFAAPKYFPYAIMKQFMVNIDEAYKAIEPLKTSNPVAYEKYYDRILLESLCPRFTILDRHAAELTETELLTMAQEFKKDATHFNLERYAESRNLSTKYKEWGIA